MSTLIVDFKPEDNALHTVQNDPDDNDGDDDEDDGVADVTNETPGADSMAFPPSTTTIESDHLDKPLLSRRQSTRQHRAIERLNL